MLKMVLLRFNLDRKKLGMTVGEANRFYRRLYGYHSSSFYGRYHNWIDGLLDEINGRKVANSAIMVPETSYSQLTKYLNENGATVEIVSENIFIEEDEFGKIKSMGKDEVTPK